MLKTILIIVLIAGAIFAGLAVCAYVLHVEFAENIMNNIIPQDFELSNPFINEEGNISLPNVASVASLATAAGTGIKFLNEQKQKVTALKQVAQTQYENSGLSDTVETLKGTKSNLETQLAEAAKLKEEALEQANAAQSEIANLKQEITNQQTSLNTLNKLVQDMKNDPKVIQITR